jgi:putative addiction module killer protein
LFLLVSDCGMATVFVRKYMRTLDSCQPNLGDSKNLRGDLMEMRIDYGPAYYVRRAAEIVILLWAGEKRTQQRDFKRARVLAERL